MRHSRLSRHIMRAATVTSAVSLAVSIMTAATASPARASNAGLATYNHSATHSISVPSRTLGAIPGLRAGTPVIIHDKSDTSGILGYLVCLYNSQNNCLADFSDEDFQPAGPDTGNVVIDFIGYIGDGVTVWNGIKTAYKTYKWIKKYAYNGKHTIPSKYDGQCFGAWGDVTEVHLGSCNSTHGIYWQLQSDAHLWNTYSKADMLVVSNSPGTPVVVGPPHAGEWVEWVTRALCDNGC